MSENPISAISDATASVSTQEEPLIMQIVVRKDLLDTWGIGPLMAQVAHATAAILHETRDSPDTSAYLADLTNMRKVVMQVLEASALQKLADLLTKANTPHHLWIEQPENEPTCIALAPNRKPRETRKALDKAGARVWRT